MEKKAPILTRTVTESRLPTHSAAISKAGEVESRTVGSQGSGLRNVSLLDSKSVGWVSGVRQC